LCDRVTKLL